MNYVIRKDIRLNIVEPFENTGLFSFGMVFYKLLPNTDNGSRAKRKTDIRNKSEISLVDDLRNKLSDAECEIETLKECKRALEDDIRRIEEKLEGKQIVIENLQKTIEKFSTYFNKSRTVSIVGTQTDVPSTSNNTTQTNKLHGQHTQKTAQISPDQLISNLNRVVESVHQPVLQPSSPNQGNGQLSKILLLGDSQFRNMATVAREIFGGGYIIEFVFKPNPQYGNSS
ncbi:hypothetical protein QE152_g1170 [Popillia japonica]|uniref:Uncharacterized protein n=1 Tax=Popillia japonica TaxID=7064 RepID=A0AAW1N9P8_POPJA